MAKKFRSTSASDSGHQTENSVKQQESSGGASDLLGLSLKSKKIKKKKGKKVQANILEYSGAAVAVDNGNGNGTLKQRKKNKNKHKKSPVTLEETIEKNTKIKSEEEPNTEQVSKKFEKKKKNHSNVANVNNSNVTEIKCETNETSIKKDKKKKKKNRTNFVESNEENKVEQDDGSVSKQADKHKRKGSEVQSEEVSPKKKHKKKNKLGKTKANDESQSEQTAKGKVNKPKVKNLDADRDVVTSESESEDDRDAGHNEMDKVNQNILKQYQSKESPADDDQKKADKEVKKEKRFEGPEHSIFIGNLPNTVKKSTMKSRFKKYGNILTLRFRSNDGVTLFKKKDRKNAKALICYIRFETKAEAQAACAMNGELFEGNRIRVTMHMQKQMGHASSTVFVGNINRQTTDNELYDFFSRAGELEYVRQIADKGIGYVCFKKGVSIAKALKLNQQLLNGRPLRIMKLDPAKQVKRKNKKGNLVDKQHRGGRPVAVERNDHKQDGAAKQKPLPKEFHGAIADKGKMGKKHNKMKKGGSDKKKKLLAQKLNAAGRNK